jgi:hypothetical protein
MWLQKAPPTPRLPSHLPYRPTPAPHAPNLNTLNLLKAYL